MITAATTTSSTARRPGRRSPIARDWIFCLVRTDPDAKPQEGISFLLIDMKTPGVTVRPIITLDGAHDVNDVFLDNVKVPVENRIGHENRGLDLRQVPAGQRAAGHRRGGGLQARRAELARHRAQRAGERGQPGRRSGFRRKIAELDLSPALEFTELRTLSAMAQGGAPGPEVSILKINGTEIQQRIAELALEAVGDYAQPYQPGMLFENTNETPVGPDYAPPAAPRYFNMRKTTIYGGCNEIQKNIISKMVLGL